LKKIALVTDSTADLTPELIEQFEINIIPLNVIFGDEIIKDNQITADDFYTRLKKSEVLPKTSQPSPEEFLELYKNLLEDYQEIISIHISSALSGTLNSARLAKEKLNEPIHIVDTHNISLGAAFLVLEAAEFIEKKYKTTEILQHLQKTRNKIETLFTLDTMEYLYKGGRIGKVSSLLGAALNIKPVIRVNEEGVYVPYGKTRNQKKALDKITAFFKEKAEEKTIKRIAVAHGQAKDSAEYLSKALSDALSTPVDIFTKVGPIIGVHTGPGTVGAAIQME